MDANDRINSDIVRRIMEDNDPMTVCMDNIISGTTSGLTHTNIEDIKKASKICKLSKEEKAEKKTIQLFCSNDFDKSKLIQQITVPEKKNSGPQTFSIGDKIQVVEEGWAGNITAAFKFKETGMWEDVQSKSFVYIQRAPYKLKVMFEKEKEREVYSRRQTVRHMLFETANSYPGIIVDRGVFYLTEDTSVQDLKSCAKYCKSEFKILIPAGVTLHSIFGKREYLYKNTFSRRIDTIRDKVFNING